VKIEQPTVISELIHTAKAMIQPFVYTMCWSNLLRFNSRINCYASME